MQLGILLGEQTGVGRRSAADVEQRVDAVEVDEVHHALCDALCPMMHGQDKLACCCPVATQKCLRRYARAIGSDSVRQPAPGVPGAGVETNSVAEVGRAVRTKVGVAHVRIAEASAVIGDEQVAVEISSVIRASDSSFRVAWTERRYLNGQLARTERWTAILTVVIQPPRTAEALRKNPLGVFVHAINWSRENAQ